MSKATVKHYSEVGMLDMSLDDVSYTISSYPESPEKAEAVEAVEALGAAAGNKRKVKQAAKTLLEKLEAMPATAPTSS